MAVVRDYVDSWSSEELLAIPPQCRPGRIRDREDVCDWAVVLAREELKTQPPEIGAHLLDHMTTVFKEAAARLTQLALESRPPGPHDSA